MIDADQQEVPRLPLLARLRPADGHERDRHERRRVFAPALTALAVLFVLVALLMPSEFLRLTPAAFVRIPVEALAGVLLLLALPGRTRRVAAVVAGVALGLLAILKVLDLGFSASLARPFDPLGDGPFLEASVDFLTRSIGRTGAIGAVVAAALLTLALVVLMPLAVLRLTRIAAAHRTTALRTTAVLGLVWVICAVAGVRIVSGLPVADTSTSVLAYDHVRQVRQSIADQEVFDQRSKVDAFGGAPDADMLPGLRGKDVILAFVESYGRSAIEHPQLAPRIGALLDAGTARLRADGFGMRSGFLTSSTSGGGSWLAHSTLQSGLWVDNQQRYSDLIASDRLTLSGAFQRSGWRTVGVAPANTEDWPEGKFYKFDRVYDFRDIGYRGPAFSFGSTPDQFTLSAFERLERAVPDRAAPVFAEIDLLSSHAPWTPVPRLLDWNAIGDGSVFNGMVPANQPNPLRNGGQLRADYGRSIEYSLSSLISYVETYGDDNLVLILVGDHQPAPSVTGEGAGRDVPISIVAHDPAILDRISDWGWQDGLKPSPQAPVWRMDAFRDRVLRAFGP
jgi:hypothetical protein